MNLLKMLCLFTMVINTLLKADNYKPKIAVIGAGLAGLTAAYRLNQKGLNVDVYEARNRVGGRIFTAVIDNKVVELGGQNLRDGGDAHHMLNLVNELKLELVESSYPFGRQYYKHGVFVPENRYFEQHKFDAETLDNQLKALALKSKNMKDVLLGLFSEDEDIYHILSTRLAGYEGDSPEKLSVFYINTLYHMLLGGACAAHPASGIAYQELIIKGGNGLLPEKLRQKIGNHVHLNMVLESVSKNSCGSFILTFKNGQRVVADILVLAVPATVFKDIVFDQDVAPESRLSTIQKIECGSNAKILIPVTCSLGDNGRYLNERLGTFPDANGTVLTLYYRSEDACFSSESITDRYHLAKVMLEADLPAQCLPDLLPIVAFDESFACYAGPIGHSWPNDPYARGSYSYIAPGQETLLTELSEHEGETVKVLFTPVDNKLYFAGEHTSTLMEVPGTMEAACESGERVARMIHKAINRTLFTIYPIFQLFCLHFQKTSF